MAIRAGILPRSLLWKELQRKPVHSLAEFNRRALQVVGLEEAERALDNPDTAATSTAKKNDSGSGQKGQDNSKRKNGSSHGDGGKKKKEDQYVPLYHVHTELNQSREHIFMNNERAVPFRRADTMRGPKSKRDPNKYCRYHRDRRHKTEEYRQLKDEIEGLISRGYLRQYVRNQGGQPQNNGRQVPPPQA